MSFYYFIFQLITVENFTWCCWSNSVPVVFNPISYPVKTQALLAYDFHHSARFSQTSRDITVHDFSLPFSFLNPGSGLAGNSPLFGTLCFILLFFFFCGRARTTVLFRYFSARFHFLWSLRSVCSASLLPASRMAVPQVEVIPEDTLSFYMVLCVAFSPSLCSPPFFFLFHLSPHFHSDRELKRLILVSNVKIC